jgi:hypothetical protein
MRRAYCIDQLGTGIRIQQVGLPRDNTWERWARGMPINGMHFVFSSDELRNHMTPDESTSAGNQYAFQGLDLSASKSG